MLTISYSQPWDSIKLFPVATLQFGGINSLFTSNKFLPPEIFRKSL